MKVVVAEKPSVARDIARVLGADQKQSGYLEGNNHAVTWAFGHLLTDADPGVMNSQWASAWSFDALPMFPDRWQYAFTKDRSGTTASSEKQFTIVKRLLDRADTTGVVCATDAEREGEYIFRLILEHAKCVKPVQRLWISSLTDDSIRSGFAKLRPASDFDRLAQSAYARSQADWLVGMNLTRAYTVLNSEVYSIGRVQTPTLALVVAREHAITSFAPVAFFEVEAEIGPGIKAKYFDSQATDHPTRISNRIVAHRILTEARALTSASVASFDAKRKSRKAPQLYDLLSLQKDANAQHGYTAQQTLDLAQQLYETHKVLTYPRTESRHLSNDMVPGLPAILHGLTGLAPLSAHVATALQALASGKSLGTEYVDDTKLTDHHAIIPTLRKSLPPLEPDAQNIYNLVARRFVGVFLAPEVREETTAVFDLGPHKFRATTTSVVEPGWTVVLPPNAPDTTKTAPALAAVPVGSAVALKSVELLTGQTTPPNRYDDASLLTAMKTAGKNIEDDELAEHMKASGLGTAATRAQIIERLLAIGYVRRDKKSFVPTAKGLALIAQVHPNLKDPALTAEWEQRLSRIEAGDGTSVEFLAGVRTMVSRIIGDCRSAAPIASPAISLGQCPACRDGRIQQTKKGLGCSRWREGCKWALWSQQFGKTLTPNQLLALLTPKGTSVIKGFKTKDGSRSYDARLVLENGRVKPIFAEKTGQPAK